MAGAGFDVGRHCRRFLREGHNGLLGLRHESHDGSQVELSMPAGISADAVLTLLDMAGTLAVMNHLQRPCSPATVDMRVDHLGVVLPEGAVSARARCHHFEGGVARVQATAGLPGSEIAVMHAIYVLTEAA